MNKFGEIQGDRQGAVIWGYDERGLEIRVAPEGLLLSDLPADTITQGMADGELLHAVTMATVRKSGRAGKGGARCEEMNAEGGEDLASLTRAEII